MQGLPSAQVLVNREKYGRNMLTPPKTKPAWVKYLEQYKNFFAILLIVASTLCFIAFGVDSSHDKTNVSFPNDAASEKLVWIRV